ncbi:hypothetical protein HK099_006797 [Clydaea vesicula]|uniref:Uncharacterized protein n=1 Tax=Clydaea vesicula TaxID=447962 RepID=A0AAD5TZL5_9FUNG|nr:hypothetical protein HK099_006797 [Clydaea vesicula]
MSSSLTNDEVKMIPHIRELVNLLIEKLDQQSLNDSEVFLGSKRLKEDIVEIESFKPSSLNYRLRDINDGNFGEFDISKSQVFLSTKLIEELKFPVSILALKKINKNKSFPHSQQENFNPYYFFKDPALCADAVPFLSDCLHVLQAIDNLSNVSPTIISSGGLFTSLSKEIHNINSVSENSPEDDKMDIFDLDIKLEDANKAEDEIDLLDTRCFKLCLTHLMNPALCTFRAGNVTTCYNSSPLTSFESFTETRWISVYPKLKENNSNNVVQIDLENLINEKFKETSQSCSSPLCNVKSEPTTDDLASTDYINKKNFNSNNLHAKEVFIIKKLPKILFIHVNYSKQNINLQYNQIVIKKSLLILKELISNATGTEEKDFIDVSFNILSCCCINLTNLSCHSLIFSTNALSYNMCRVNENGSELIDGYNFAINERPIFFICEKL